jgi:hypothetical protein
MATILDDPPLADELPADPLPPAPKTGGGEPQRRKVAKAIACSTSEQLFYSIAF